MPEKLNAFHAPPARTTHVPATPFLSAPIGKLTLDGADLELVAAATIARFEEPMLEAERIRLVTEVQRAARDVSRLLQHWVAQALTDCRGSRSTRDLATTNRLYVESLADYAQTIKRVASALRTLAPALAAN
jgi:hypothetical protein